MKWATAVRRLDEVAAECTRMARMPASIFAIQVDEAWVFGPLLAGTVPDLADADDPVRVALVFRSPREEGAGVDDLPWGTSPRGGEHWLSATRLEKLQVRARFRPAGRPVANHAIVRPLRFWTRAEGTDEAAVQAVLEGRVEHLRLAAPDPAQAQEERAAEVAVSLAGLRAGSADYEAQRWDRGGHQKRADALADALAGYLDLLDAGGHAGHG